MNYIIVGLGNPGDEYADTRHNTGRIVLEHMRRARSFSEWETDKKCRALISKGKIGKHSLTLLLPDNFMNNSGKILSSIITSADKAKGLVVVYDDIDLPIGALKVSWNRGSGGHKGLESIIRNIRTKAFVRIRVGIAPTSPSGKIKKPKGEAAVEAHILGTFKPKERDILNKVSKRADAVLGIFVESGLERAMMEGNTK
ncbi:aminoacyl-tRNA hydrolase [bacterium]|nr:aminoacyl-tRNA hydrolase [bacterium]MCI0680393.1 aminoacyl-tRNA hydrolase [bacterium]